MSQTHGSLPSRLTPVTFAMRGIVPIGYAVFALVLGVAIGLVVRRPVPAMAITLVLYIFVQIAVPLWVRPHLATPIRENVSFSRQRMDGIMADASGKAMRITLNTGSQGNWVLTNETINAAGQATALPSWMNQCLPGPPAPGPDRSVVVEAPPIEGCLTRLNAEGYRQHIVYQPANRFWRLQWTETAMFLAFSGVLTWFSFWWIRRRVS
jgi:hypothetical protein